MCATKCVVWTFSIVLTADAYSRECGRAMYIDATGALQPGVTVACRFRNFDSCHWHTHGSVLSDDGRTPITSTPKRPSFAGHPSDNHHEYHCR